MEEAPENGKESSRSAHASGMDELKQDFCHATFLNTDDDSSQD
jgi:hypothetical protein